MVYSYTELVSCDDLIKMDPPIWDNQRPPNKFWIEKIKSDQRNFYNKYNLLCFPGTIVLINYNDKLYIADGQHRYQAIKELLNEGFDLSPVQFVVQTYHCGNNHDLARDTYFCANKRCEDNVGVSIIENSRDFHNPPQIPKIPQTPKLPQISQMPQTHKLPQIPQMPQIPKILQMSKITQQTISLPNIDHYDIILTKNIRIVCDSIGTTFSGQQGMGICKAPKFSIGSLAEEIRKSGILNKLTPDQAISIILNSNNNFAHKLVKDDINQYNKCISGFYLPYMKKGSKSLANCKWVHEIFKEYL